MVIERPCSAYRLLQSQSRNIIFSLRSSRVQRTAPARYFQTSSPCLSSTQNSMPAAYWRGGTSRAMMLKKSDLPSDRDQWPAIFRALLGSPDAFGRQLDGMGGGLSSLSKVCVVAPSEHPDADIDYTFAAIGIKDSSVDFSSNCGNMTCAIAPFAVDHGLVNARVPEEAGGESEVMIRIHNTNTGKIVHSTFRIDSESQLVQNNEFAISGVSTTSSKIELAFLNPGGSKTGKVLPTGELWQLIDGVRVTCIDVGNPCIFAFARDFGVSGTITPEEIEKDAALMSRIELVRRKGAVSMGVAEDETSVPGSIPKIALISRAGDYKLPSGLKMTYENHDITVRAMSVGQPHRAVPITVSLAMAAASKIEGTLVAIARNEWWTSPLGLTIAHPSGSLVVGADVTEDNEVKTATVYGTARKIMEGKAYWKAG